MAQHNYDPSWELSVRSRLIKRTFDIVAAIFALFCTGWIIAMAFIAATIDTRKSGFYTQVRVGRHGKPFRILKIRTMRNSPFVTTRVTTANDTRITRLGRAMRKLKVDELPQLLNVLAGQMSFVGPRPDVPGFADRLCGDDRIILTVRPGITGPATLKYRHEESLLAGQENPELFNREFLYPNKVQINKDYVRYYNFSKDLKCLWMTFF